MSALVFVSDPDPFSLRMFDGLCVASGHRMEIAANGSVLLDMVARQRPNLVVCDISTEKLDGFEVLRVLKSDPDLAAIPVILVISPEVLEARSRAIELGADDYLIKPYCVFEVPHRINQVLRLASRTSAAPSAMVDPLTRAGTAQQLMISVDYEYTRAARYGHALTCVVLNVQNLEAITESHGQEAREGAVVQIANGLRGCIRGVDHLFRPREHVFAMVLPETDGTGAAVVQQRIEESADTSALWAATIEPKPTIRIGVTSFPNEKLGGGYDLLQLALDRAGVASEA